jgi:hypothetical protein
MPDDKRGAGAQHKILNLAWLPHFRESEPKRPHTKPVKPVELLQADVTAGFLKPDGVNRDSKLQGFVDDILLKENPELKAFNFSLVDLSKVVDPKKDKPKYSGHNDLVPQFGASLLKIATMYAAYQLQYDLNVMAQKNPAWDSKKLFDEARSAWADTQVPVKGATAEAVRPGDPAKFKRKNKLIQISGSNVALEVFSWDPGYRPNKFFGAPNLEHIFADDPNPIGDRGLTFRKKGAASQAEIENYLKTKHNAQDLRDAYLPFSERMYLMADHSDNSAAWSCASDVGFLYIHSALWQADLYNPQRGGGMTLTLPYGAPQWKQGGVLGGGAQHSTAIAMAALMTLIVTDGIVSPAACDQMKWLLNKQKSATAKVGNWMDITDPAGSGTYSPVKFSLENGFIGNAFKWNGTTITPTQVYPDKVFSKLGLFIEGKKPNQTHLESDCAYVERKVGARTLKYVISFLNWRQETVLHGPRAIIRQRLIAGLEKCVLENT